MMVISSPFSRRVPGAEMSLDQRYARQLLQWGEENQRRLQNSAILITGIGGLGGTVAQLLARAGIGRLDLLDDGQVDWPDLNRQTLYTETDIGRPKVEAAAAYLRRVNSDTEIRIFHQRIDENYQPPAGINLVADCLDNFPSRFALEQSLPTSCFLVHGGLEGHQGQVLTSCKGQSQPLGEIFAGSRQPRGEIPATGAGAAIIAGLMVNELQQIIFGHPGLLNRFLIVGLDDPHFSFLEV